jgi:hypothetical protein
LGYADGRSGGCRCQPLGVVLVIDAQGPEPHTP